MTVAESLSRMAPELTEWRRDLHRHPELSGQEQRTATLVAERLRAFGLEPHEGIGCFGVVAVVEGRERGPTVALRADTDALPMEDASGQAYASTVAGCAHTCGHDGHTTALLGVAAFPAWLLFPAGAGSAMLAP